MTNQPQDIATKCDKCGQSFKAGQTIVGNESYTKHDKCPELQD